MPIHLTPFFPPFLAVALGLSSSALAQQPSNTDIETRERAALAACDGGKTDEGIESLGRLYADTLEPTYIYNQGRCYQKAGRSTDALNRFREFLRVNKDPNNELAGRAREFVQGLEVDLSRAVIPPPPPPPSTVGSPPPGPEASLSAESRSDDGKRRTLRIAGYSLAGLGVAGLATGSFLSFKARSVQSDVDDGLAGKPPTLDGRALDDKLATGKRLETWQWVSYLTGAAALAGAGACLYLGLRPESAAGGQGVALVPYLGPGLGGAGVRGTF